MKKHSAESLKKITVAIIAQLIKETGSQYKLADILECKQPLISRLLRDDEEYQNKIISKDMALKIQIHFSIPAKEIRPDVKVFQMLA